MNIPQSQVTRRQILAGAGALALGTAASAPSAQPPTKPVECPTNEAVPIKGEAGPGLEAFDSAMLQIMDRHGIPGSALAIAKNGKLLLAKGYGWSSLASGTPVTPETLFGLASLSKSITAVATLKLVEQGKLGLDDPVFAILKGIRPPLGTKVDPQLAEVTVRHCLNHSGGWDRGAVGDPVNWQPQICRAFGLRPPLRADQFLSFMLTRPLEFKPGTDMKYSNVGFIILGEVITAVTGQPYDRFVIDNILKPMGITCAGLHGFDGEYAKDEAHRHLSGTYVALPPMQLPMISAAGGWSASVVDMVRFLTNFDGTRGIPVLNENTRQLMVGPPPKPLKPRDNGTYFGLGWDSAKITDKLYACYKEGSYQGMRTFMKRLDNGVCWALLYNASMEFDPQDTQIANGTVQEVRLIIEAMKTHPDVDLFKNYP